MRILAAFTLLVAVGLAQVVAASPQDPATYPAGIADVRNTPIEAGQEFQVDVRTQGPADSVTVTVCNFKSLDADGPESCFMNPEAKRDGDAWSMSTSAAHHPTWRQGWVIGYKVTVAAGAGESHAPDRTTASGDPDYYRIVVGQPEAGRVPQGSAEVVDDPPAAVAPPQTATHPAGGAAFGCPLALACAAALVRRR